MRVFHLTTTACGIALLATAMFAGCAQQDPVATEVASKAPAADSAAPSEGHDHSGWWCVEHGIPEEVCSMCSSKAAEDFKAKGDWCEEHHRALSQCFKCDPSRAEKFAQLYRAKYGNEPPKPTD